MNKWVIHERFWILVLLNLTICKKRSKIRLAMSGHREKTLRNKKKLLKSKQSIFVSFLMVELTTTKKSF